MSFESPIPQDMEKVIEMLRNNAQASLLSNREPDNLSSYEIS